MTLKFDDIYKSYAATVYRIGVLYFRDAAAAEDVVHDVFVMLLKKTPVIRDEGHLKGWLITTARNHCRTLAKRSLRYVPLDESVPCRAAEDNAVLGCILRLPELDRTVIYLHYYEGYASKEIAALLRTSDGAVRARLKRARAQLREILEESNG